MLDERLSLAAQLYEPCALGAAIIWRSARMFGSPTGWMR